tara:strand:- start:12468 stop:13343 length:876 start_codon:yes stop_codon:yes gene_type:complete
LHKYQFIKIICFLTIFVLIGCTQTRTPELGGQTAQNVTPNLSSSPLKTEFTLPEQSLNSNQNGIWVTGRGEISAKPDLAIISAGVEVTNPCIERPVKTCYSQPALVTAKLGMEEINKVIKAKGIQEKDISTTRFNVQAKYAWDDKIRAQVLVGYTVTNIISIKLRDLDLIGELIDEIIAVEAKIKPKTNQEEITTKINSVNFTVDNTEQYEKTLISKAIEDAINKANLYAEFSKVKLGNLIYLSEGSQIQPRPQQEIGLKSMAFAESSSTPINIGEFNLQISVYAGFKINK